VPGSGTLTFAPVVVTMFYSPTFAPAVEVLRWFCLGMMLRVVTWPLGFLVVAKDKAKVFFWSDLASNLVQICLVWGLVLRFGLKGAGMGFFGMYIFYWVVIYMVGRRLSGFRWSTMNRRLALFFAPQIAGLFIACYILPQWATIVLGAAMTAFACFYSARTLAALIPSDHFPRPARRLLVLCRLVPPADAA